MHGHSNEPEIIPAPCPPEYTTDDDSATKNLDSTTLDTLPPTFFSSRVKLMPGTNAEEEKEVSQHLFNTTSTSIQHPLNVEWEENAQTVDGEINTEDEKFIQHTTEDEGERGGKEQVKSDSVLQNAPKEGNKSVEVQT